MRGSSAVSSLSSTTSTRIGPEPFAAHVRRPLFRRGDLRDDRQRDRELRAAHPFARDRHRPAVHLDQALDEREPMPSRRACARARRSPAGRRGRRCAAARSFGMPTPVSRTEIATPPRSRDERSAIVAATRRELRRVGEQVGQHLHEARAVALDPHGRRRRCSPRSCATPPRAPDGSPRPRSRSRRAAAGALLPSSILLRVMRDTSSRSSMRRVMCATWRSMMSRAPSRSAARRARPSAARARRCGSASGLRSSCASMARTSSLRRLASCSSSMIRTCSASSSPSAARCRAPR